MEQKFIINDFEGPLDLLLHLIKKDDLDIANIKIDIITKQYVDFIKQMEELNLDVASEYLVLAAELIEMKSRLLIPSIKEESYDDENPENELIMRLQEYEKYKSTIGAFKELEAKRKCVYTKVPANMNLYKDINYKPTSNLSLDDLVSAFDSYLKRKKFEKPLHTKITNKEISVGDCSDIIIKKLTENIQFEFIELFDIINRTYVIVFFLAILELVKKGVIVVIQDDNFEEILIKKVGV